MKPVFWLNVIVSSILVFSSTSIFAAMNTIMDGAQSQWLCSAYDDKNKQWLAKSNYKQVAINKAYDSCKNESLLPGSCRAANEYCEALIKGKSARPKWRCSALDHQANLWVGDVYTNRHDAAIGALDYCETRSGSPNTCYVNLLTCKYLNEY